VTAFEALFETRPFIGSTFAELAQNVADGNIVAIPPHTDVPLRVQRAISRGLAPAASERWASMRALLDELDEIVAMEDIQAYLERTRDARTQIDAHAKRPAFRCPSACMGENGSSGLCLDVSRARGPGVHGLDCCSSVGSPASENLRSSMPCALSSRPRPRSCSRASSIL
jgi:hypothetical protein